MLTIGIRAEHDHSRLHTIRERVAAWFALPDPGAGAALFRHVLGDESIDKGHEFAPVETDLPTREMEVFHLGSTATSYFRRGPKLQPSPAQASSEAA